MKKLNMIKCYLLISYDQCLENYKLSIQEANKEESKEDKINELMLLSKEEKLIVICKDNELPSILEAKKN